MFTQVTGYTFQDLQGKNPLVLNAGVTPKKVYEDLWKTILSGHVWHGDLLNRRKDGKIYAESLYIAPLKDTKGDDRTQKMEDMYWILLNSTEFSWNH